jgi:hypothetical protein
MPISRTGRTLNTRATTSSSTRTTGSRRARAGDDSFRFEYRPELLGERHPRYRRVSPTHTIRFVRDNSSAEPS